MDSGIITELSNYLGVTPDAAIELVKSLGNNPEVVKGAVTGLVSSLGKVFGESGLELLGKGRDNFFDTAGKLTQQGKEVFIPIARKYIENYTARHGQLKVLGMGKPVSLESIYTQVNFDPEFIQTFQTVDTHEQAFRRRDWSKKDCRLGMKVANETPYMMVLGGPGMGKSTFLRRVGLEALKRGSGEYQHTCIPVFMELRKYHWEKATGINLQEKIAEEFQYCGLPEYQDCTERLLKQGKLLILFDGLDEVPTDLLGQMTTAIKNLVDLYPQNRFIASCRIAAYRPFQNFSRFTDVAIANFDKQQIKYFIDNWFKSHDREEWGQECWTRLNSSEHQATRELAQTPLLLTLICILFLKRGEFPSKRATLYADALWTLLSEWDASKDIVRQKPYKGLDTKCKEVMLAEIAYSNFIANNLFFQQGEIALQIEQILQEMLDEKWVDGREVLRAVEEQHGLLVNRYEYIFSFSHLTIQEFLTAKHINDNQLDISKIVKEHLCDKRWREVFLLLAGLRKADELLLAMEREVRKYVDTSRLQGLLAWVEKVTDPRSGEVQTVGKRASVNAIAIAIANANANANTIVNANANADTIVNADTITIANAFANTNTFAIANAFAIANGNGNANAFAYINNYASAFANTNAIAYAIAYAIDNAFAIACEAINYFIRYTKWAMEFEIYQGLDLAAAISQVERLKSQIPDEKQPKEVHQNFARRLIEIFLAAFHLTPKMVNLSKEEVKAYENYLYGVRLMIECERAAVRRTPEVWSKIEERLLLPNRRVGESNING